VNNTEYSTYGKRNKEYESSNSNASFIRGEVNVHGEPVEGNVPVRAFVSIVRRTKRVITKLENLPALPRVRDCWVTLSRRVQMSREKHGEVEGGEGGSLTSNTIAMAIVTSEITLEIDHN